jgi:hypothetical protein
MRTYKTEFANYDDELSLPDGWIDTSWHNDVSPSFEKQYGDATYRIWCDYKDPEKREVGGKQFTVYVEDLVINVCIGQFETLLEALELVNKETE